MRRVIQEINKIASEIKRSITLMEVCGTHTQAISRYGIRSLFSKNIRLISGPGCPVCVTSQKDIDTIVNLALAGIPIATYGDVMRVPGYWGSLDEAGGKGAKIFTIYSTEDALDIQKKYPDLVFFGLGFETTAPMTAFAIKKGLTVFSSHKLFLQAMRALLQMDELKIDGFICPGHVSTITGVKPYRKMFVSKDIKRKIPQVITGFEREDILQGIYMLLKQIQESRAEIENEYTRSVQEEGNQQAMNLMFEVFEPDKADWRGLGIILRSGLKIKSKYKKFDAKIKYKNILSKIDFSHSDEPSACLCGQIICGLKMPADCFLFKRVCTPETPNGPCMVSVEGACNVEYRYHRNKK